MAERIKQGRGSATAVEAINLAISQHDQDTRQLINTRKAEIQPMHEERGALITAHDTALEAIAELRKLAENHPHLLAGFPIPGENELK